MNKDIIYRQAAIDAVEYWHGVDVSEALGKVPSAQTEQKKGIWLSKNLPICIGAKELVEVYICSNCGHVVDGNDLSNFCSVCGCDMRGDNE